MGLFGLFTSVRAPHKNWLATKSGVTPNKRHEDAVFMYLQDESAMKTSS